VSFEDTGRHLEATDQLLDRAKKLAKSGQLDDAEELCTNLLASFVRLYGTRSLKTATCLITLAEVNYAQRKYAEVITHLEQVLVTNEKDAFLGDDEAQALYFKLAKSFERSGNQNEACFTYLSLLKLAQESQGDSASFTRKILESLRSITKRNPGKFPEAERTLEDLAQFDSNMRLVNVSKLRTIAVKDQSSFTSAVSEVKSKPNTRLAMLTAACALCLWFLIAGTLHGDPSSKGSADATAALTPRTPGGLHMYAGAYSTTDGVKQLNLVDEQQGSYTCAEVNDKVKVSTDGAELHAQGKSANYVFRTSGQALVDADGAKLYRTGSPEMKTVESMYRTAETLNRYFQSTGHYPHSRGELNSVAQSMIYTNPCTLQDSYPALQVLGNKKMKTIDDFNSSSNLEVGLVSMSAQQGQPGGVEVVALPMSMSGDTYMIRGYDRDGMLLPCSVGGKCFNLKLVSGSIRR